MVNKVKTAVLGTKPNEALFSTTKEHIMTPDALEFAIIFPKIVNEHIKMCSGQSGFLYVTSLNNRYYDLPDSFENIQRFKIPKLTRIEIPKSDLQLLKN